MTQQTDKHYQSLDDDANAQLKAMYGDSLQGESQEDAPEEGTASDNSDNEEAEELEQSTPETENEPQKDNEDSEPMVSESRYKSAVVAMNKAQQEAAELRKSIQALQSENQELQSMLEEALNVDDDRSTDNDSDDYDFDKAIDDLPLLMKQNKELVSKIAKLETELATVKTTTDRVQEQDNKTAHQNYWNEIKGVHGDIDGLVEDPEYSEWWAQQPQGVKSLLTSSDAQEVIKGLNLFRADVPRATDKKPSTSRNDKLEAARNADSPTIQKQSKEPSSPKRTFTNAEIAKMSPAEFARNEKAIDAALARGDVI